MRVENNPTQSLIAFIWHFVRPYRGKFLCLLFVALAWGIEMSVRPYTLKLILDRLEIQTSESGSIVLALLLPAAAYLGCEAAINIIFRFYDSIRMFVYPHLQADIIRETTAYVQGHSHGFFLHRLSGSIASQMKELATGIKELLQITINRFFSHFFAFIVACGTIIFVSPIFTVIVLVWALFFILTTVYLSKKAVHVSKEASQIRNQTVGQINDMLLNMMAVKLFARHDYEIARVDEQLLEQIAWDKKCEWTNFKIRTVQGSSIFAMMTLLLATLIHARSQGLVTIGDFALILTIGISISAAIQNLSQDLLIFSELVGKCKTSLQLIETPHEITDTREAKPIMVTNGEVVFDGVTFSYDPGRPFFQDLSVKINGGEKVGLVGFSGAGKSTFVHLIVRLFECQNGSISIDGQKIHEVLQGSLRTKISLIPQDPPLFHRSVRDNILYGRAQASEEEFLEACRQAHVLEFVQAFPQGFDTIVGERGVRLSGGQRQRIAIARAILKNAPILILDEATSSLDSSSEREIQKSLEFLMQKKTVFVIAHRLSTLRSMNRLLVFNQGKIVEDGSHQALLALQGYYANLWNIHSGNFSNSVS